MKVCFAVEKDDGINSAVYGHFGSAPVFIMVDMEKESVSTVGNRDLDHFHGACSPIQAIGGQAVDAVVVGGIGAGAISGLNAQGIQVYQSKAETIRQNLDLLKDGKLPLLSLQNACKGHQSGECGHQGS
jgi:predicted Fe-Mo cluster-binding NifX family protein